MTLTVTSEPVPLAVDRDGAARVGGTRVTLNTLVSAFREGATAEEIAQQYPPLRLADVYSVVGYYLRHRGEVEEYFRERERRAGLVRRENESRFDPEGVRDRLTSRRSG